MFREFNQSIAHIVVLGQTQEQIVDTAKQVGYQNITLADSWRTRVQRCRALASLDERVLSPACASWDMFSDYEERAGVSKNL